MSFASDPPPPDGSESLGLRVQCAYALGRLDGALRSLTTETERLLAAALLGRTLVMVLRDAAYTDAETAFPRWLARGSPPQAEPQVVLGTSALIEAALHQLEQSSWLALGESTAILRRAAPHLTTPVAGHSSALAHAKTVLDQARQITCLKSGSSVDASLVRLADLIDAASASPIFALGHADLATFTVRQGRRGYYKAALRPHLWALGLVVGGALHQARLLSRTVPMGGSIPLGAVRTDLSRAERSAFLFAGLTSTAETILQLIEDCRERHAHTKSALGGFRTTSKAPAVLDFLAGTGPLTRAQIAAGFGVSRQGASGIIDALVTAGLVTRENGVIRACPIREKQAFAESTSTPLPPLTSLAEVDDALAALDALLTRTGPPEAESS